MGEVKRTIHLEEQTADYASRLGAAMNELHRFVTELS